MHVHFCVAVLSIKDFEEEREIVRACRAQSKIFYCSDLLFESDAQFLFVERLLAAKFNDAGLLGAFFLLFHNRSPRLLLIFWPHNIDALRCDMGCRNDCAEN